MFSSGFESTTPWVWVIEHLSAVGWPVIVVLAWKVSKYFERIAAQVSKTISQIDTMSTNHFPHMQTSLQTQDALLHSVDASLKTLVERTPSKR